MFVVYIPLVLPMSGRLEIYLKEEKVMLVQLVTQIYVGVP